MSTSRLVDKAQPSLPCHRTIPISPPVIPSGEAAPLNHSEGVGSLDLKIIMAPPGSIYEFHNWESLQGSQLPRNKHQTCLKEHGSDSCQNNLRKKNTLNDVANAILFTNHDFSILRAPFLNKKTAKSSQHKSIPCYLHPSVDGRNPAPVDMVNMWHV